MKRAHKIFFAIPFDSATTKLYEDIRRVVKKRYPRVTTVIGTEEVGPSPDYSDIASFKAQNTELNKQIAYEIRDSDVVIVDLSNNNPNVHFELGIALAYNKNVLRVTGRSLKELGFDIQNLEVFAYKSKLDLSKRILGYLRTFFSIKELRFSKRVPSLYYEQRTKTHLKAAATQLVIGNAATFEMRDGAVRIGFRIRKVNDPSDSWFGIYFRAGVNPFLGSYLAYVRRNGKLAVVSYPGQRLLKEVGGEASVLGVQTLRVDFENNYLEAKIGRTRLETDGLSNQAIGRVCPAVFGLDADVCTVEMICRDTINIPNL